MMCSPASSPTASFTHPERVHARGSSRSEPRPLQALPPVVGTRGPGPVAADGRTPTRETGGGGGGSRQLGVRSGMSRVQPSDETLVRGETTRELLDVEPSL